MHSLLAKHPSQKHSPSDETGLIRNSLFYHVLSSSGKGPEPGARGGQAEGVVFLVPQEPTRGRPDTRSSLPWALRAQRSGWEFLARWVGHAGVCMGPGDAVLQGKVVLNSRSETTLLLASCVVSRRAFSILNPSFFICKMGRIRGPTSQRY